MWEKSDLAMINSVQEKLLFTINGQSNILFFNFFLFYFCKFQMTVAKKLMEKLSFFIMNLKIF